MDLTEHQMTVAVDAAARSAYDADVARRREVFPPGVHFHSWEEQPDPMVKYQFRDGVLPIVMAALNALPDPRHDAWDLGYIAADNGCDESTNPFPKES